MHLLYFALNEIEGAIITFFAHEIHNSVFLIPETDPWPVKAKKPQQILGI